MNKIKNIITKVIAKIIFAAKWYKENEDAIIKLIEDVRYGIIETIKKIKELFNK